MSHVTKAKVDQDVLIQLNVKTNAFRDPPMTTCMNVIGMLILKCACLNQMDQILIKNAKINVPNKLLANVTSLKISVIIVHHMLVILIVNIQCFIAKLHNQEDNAKTQD